MANASNKPVNQIIRSILVLAVLAIPSLRSAETQSVDSPEFKAAIRREVGLVHLIFNKTNKFETELCDVVALKTRQPQLIVFEAASFIFFYPSSNFWVQSSTEMSRPDSIICGPMGQTVRQDSPSETPVNYLRLVDQTKAGITAEVDLIMTIGVADRPEQRRIARRTLHFVYSNGWKKK